MLEIAAETFEGSYPFAPHHIAVNGFGMHFVDEGAGPTVLMVHGDPTWGYLWRRFIPAVARGHRCIVPDHMGMGKSGSPAGLLEWRLHHHVDNLEKLILNLDLRDITLVVHDWGGPVGLGAAARHPDRVRALVLMNTWACVPWPGGPLPRLLEIIRSARGERFVLERNGYVEAALMGTAARPAALTAGVMAAYRAPFPSPESRRALLCWSRDIPVIEADPSWALMRQIEESLATWASTPALLVWGMRDPVLPPRALRQLQTALPHATTVEIGGAGHFLQEDAPEETVDALMRFLDAPRTEP